VLHHRNAKPDARGGSDGEAFALKVGHYRDELPKRFAPAAAAQSARVSHDFLRAVALAKAFDREVEIMGSDHTPPPLSGVVVVAAAAAAAAAGAVPVSSASGAASASEAKAVSSSTDDVSVERLLASVGIASWSELRKLDLVIEYLLRVHGWSYYNVGGGNSNSSSNSGGAGGGGGGGGTNNEEPKRFGDLGEAVHAGAGGAVFRDFAAATKMEKEEAKAQVKAKAVPAEGVRERDIEEGEEEEGEVEVAAGEEVVSTASSSSVSEADARWFVKLDARTDAMLAELDETKLRGAQQELLELDVEAQALETAVRHRRFCVLAVSLLALVRSLLTPRSRSRPSPSSSSPQAVDAHVAASIESLDGGSKFKCTLCSKLFRAADPPSKFVEKHVRTKHDVELTSIAHGVRSRLSLSCTTAQIIITTHVFLTLCLSSFSLSLSISLSLFLFSSGRLVTRMEEILGRCETSDGDDHGAASSAAAGEFLCFIPSYD
jgi:hypothetical protein